MTCDLRHATFDQRPLTCGLDPPKSSSRFDRLYKLDRDYSYLQIISPFWPLKYHVTYPIDPRARAKMAVSVNKVYFHGLYDVYMFKIQSFERCDVISIVDKNIDHRKLFSTCVFTFFK